jgi:hypothetical protein
MTRKIRLTIVLLVMAVIFFATRGFESSGKTGEGTPKVDFRREIEPILVGSCQQCHGAKKAAGQLRLDQKAAALKGGISGALVVPGRGRESLLIRRVLGEGGQARMPMGGEPLTPVQVELLTRWIDEGAEWPDEAGAFATAVEPPRHWAYLAPVQGGLPAVKALDQVRNPIDNFILSRLEKEGLTFSRPAAKEALLRRVYLDLVGLPPTVAEMDEFLNDRSPDAYEKLVDRLLASRHYGERWARPWLDLARYADSHGYESDGLRVMWKYRDWVIDALNRDMPFNQFTIEQIAGDMLPKPSTAQLIATGFHRNTLLNREGGTDGDEQRYEVIVDRVNTTATVWLGSTLGCAQCHNHKYDPFSQKDYYRMFAFFENAEYRIGTEPFQRFVYEPDLELPTPEQEENRKQLKTELAGLEKTLKTATPQLDKAQVEWEAEMLAEPRRWVVLDPRDVQTTGGTTLTRLADRSLLASGATPELEDYVIRATIQPKDLRQITALRIEALTDQSLPRGGPGRDLYGNFILTTIEARVDGKPLTFVDADWDNGVNKIDKKNFFNQYEPGQVTDRPRGWLINAMADEVRLDRQMVMALDRPLSVTKPVEIEVRLLFKAGGLNEAMGRVRLSVSNLEEPLRLVEIPAAQKLVLAKPAAVRTEKERTELAELFRKVTPLLKRERDRVKKIEEELDGLGIVKAMIMREQPGWDRPWTWLRERGNFASQSEKVYAGTPGSLHPLPESAPANRLGLARWLVDERNPLVARVAVNRAWEQFFGRGVVETSEDFGTQSAAPSHPELLDWLSVEFMKRGWSLKSLHRLIVTSATYRQDSAVTPALQERDPANRLLARGPRFRVEAEMIRDLALTASGLLSRKLGGPSVMPPQPEGIWRNPYSRERWQTAKGDDRYRRGIYTFLRRTSPYPAMMTFDATSREFCTVRRVRTNTPLQSLALLNDEAMMEMARALARRIYLEVDGPVGGSEAGGLIRERLAHGFRLCLSRRPGEAELTRLEVLYRQQLANYQRDPVAAGRLLAGEQRELPPAEMAALTMVANVILNLDEMVTKQ